MITLSPTRLKGQMLFVYGMRKRYPCPQHALKGQKLIAQGNALGCFGR